MKRKVLLLRLVLENIMLFSDLPLFAKLSEDPKSISSLQRVSSHCVALALMVVPAQQEVLFITPSEPFDGIFCSQNGPAKGGRRGGSHLWNRRLRSKLRTTLRGVGLFPSLISFDFPAEDQRQVDVL
jgi:hypothetical protein